MRQLSDLNVFSEKLLPTPKSIKEKLPLSEVAAETVASARITIEKILERKDPRIFVVVGPCSIHDIEAAKEYGNKIRTLADQVKDTMLVVMRVYFAKPRTTVGWKGLINDPDLDDSFKIDKGLYCARELLLHLAEKGVAAGTEALDPVTPQYMDDLIAWNAIGARTTESQTHREMASGLSSPLGFKNGTDGSIQVAINALKTVALPHHFLGINQEGHCAVIQTKGNRHGHIVLRGGQRPNYDSVSISLVEKELGEAKLPVNIVVDCSHGNSLKDPALQPLVMENCINQIVNGNKSIVGLMLESNLSWGKQDLVDPKNLRHGVSITDACIDWKTTEEVIFSAHDRLKDSLKRRLR